MLRLFVLAAFIALTLSAPQSKIFSPRLDGRIVGGTPVKIEEYPYQASVLYYGFHTCGGSIISKNFVLTAAHCVNEDDPTAFSVRVGSSIKNADGEIIEAAKVYEHPQFNPSLIDYDVAVIELKKNLTYGPTINKINLPGNNQYVVKGTKCVVTGWGLLEEGYGYTKQLQATTLPIVEHEKCESIYSPSPITERMICAGVEEGGKDSCQGDSGGPLAANGELIGIVSWGFGCGRPGIPGIYTNVSNVRDYINEITKL